MLAFCAVCTLWTFSYISLGSCDCVAAYWEIAVYLANDSLSGRSSLTNEKDHHYFNWFVCVGEFFDG